MSAVPSLRASWSADENVSRWILVILKDGNAFATVDNIPGATTEYTFDGPGHPESVYTATVEGICSGQAATIEQVGGGENGSGNGCGGEGELTEGNGAMLRQILKLLQKLEKRIK